MCKVSPLLSKIVTGIAFVGVVASLTVVIHSLVTGQGLQVWELAIVLFLTGLLLQRLFRKRWGDSGAGRVPATLCGRNQALKEG